MGIGKFKIQPRLCFVVQNDGMGTQHALVNRLEGSVQFNDLAPILFDQALLAEGGLPADLVAYLKCMNALLV